MEDQAATRLAELLHTWDGLDGPAMARPAAPAAIAPVADHGAPTAEASAPLTTLGSELGERLVSEILEGVRAGRQGVFVTDPERLRTAIFVRGHTLGDFARGAGLAPSTLSRALAGQPVAPSSWRLLITALLRP